MTYIHQRKEWPHFTWDQDAIVLPLSRVRHIQGVLLGKMSALGFPLQQEATLETLTMEVLKSTEIENEFLQPEQVRSSIARRLGIEVAGLVPADRVVEGVVEMMLDATQRYDEALSVERLYGWHAALFPTGHSGMYRITVGAWRTDATGPMQVVSGPMGRERVHFQAPPAGVLHAEMAAFLDWFNGATPIDPVIKAALAHLWFVTLHPFDDGNGRIARAIAEMQLSRADGSAARYYSMSARIRQERNQYYAILESTQKGDLDITPWLLWFLACLEKAILEADTMLEKVLNKARFWERHRLSHFNERQSLMLNKLLDGFEGKLTSSKWAKIAKCSPDTALRDIHDLIEQGALQKNASGGRSTSYGLSPL